MKQRDYMKSLFKKYKGNEATIIKEYANGERSKIVRRKSNKYNLSAESYAQALYNDGIRRGWIEESI